MRTFPPLPRPLVTALAGILGFASALVLLRDYDTWFHLAMGRLQLASGLPAVNTFSWTWERYPWSNPEWLFDLALYGIHQAGGAAGVVLFSACLVSASFALAAWTALRRLEGPLSPFDALLVLAVTTLALAAVRFRFVPRPHLATLLGLALLGALWEAKPRRLPLWFLLVGVVWANCHPGVIFGLGLCVLITAGAMLEGKKAEGARAAVAGGAFLAGSLLTPGLLLPYRFALSHLGMGQKMVVDEFYPPTPGAFPGFFILATVVLLLMIPAIRRREWTPVLAGTAFLLLTLKGSRFAAKFALVALPLVAAEAALWGRRLKGKALPAALLAFALALAAGTAAWEVTARRATLAPGVGLDRRMVPEGAAAYILDSGVRGRMYNDFENGGYLIWRLFPGRQVFQDGRIPAYPVDFFVGYLSQTEESWPRLMDKSRIDFAVLARAPYAAQPLGLERIFQRMGWELLYLDGTTLLYARPGSQPPGTPAADPFQVLGAETAGEELFARVRRDSGRAREELSRVDPARLLLATDFFRWGTAAVEAGDPVRAEAFLREGVRLHPADLPLRFNLAIVLAEQGRTAEAAREFGEVARRGGVRPLGERAARNRQELLGGGEGGAILPR